MDDLNSKKYKDHANQDPDYDGISHVAQIEFLLLGNLLLSDIIVPQLIPILEKEGIAEVIKHYINSKYDLMTLFYMF